MPGEAQQVHIIRRDLGQWAEALLTVGSAVSHPVGGILVGADKPGGVRPGRFDGARGKPENKTENESRDGPIYQKHGIERHGNSPKAEINWSNANTRFQSLFRLITVQFFFFLHRTALE